MNIFPNLMAALTVLSSACSTNYGLNVRDPEAVRDPSKNPALNTPINTISTQPSDSDSAYMCSKVYEVWRTGQDAISDQAPRCSNHKKESCAFLWHVIQTFRTYDIDNRLVKCAMEMKVILTKDDIASRAHAEMSLKSTLNAIEKWSK